jgi:hypothetical protein
MICSGQSQTRAIIHAALNDSIQSQLSCRIMSSLDFLKYGLVHVAALFNVSGMFFRDQLLLRALILVSTLLYIVYYLIIPPTPLWDAIAWCVVLIGVNSVVMVLPSSTAKLFILAILSFGCSNHSSLSRLVSSGGF